MNSTVLIVDDEPSILKPLTFLLKQLGCQVHVIQDGGAVLDAVEAHDPDLILLDVMLPSRDGYELCEAIRQRSDWNDIKIIMLTVKGRAVDVERGMALGADDYITKPFPIQEVIDKVKRHLPASEA
jgi:DNA-binding response OmpR family regulator